MSEVVVTIDTGRLAEWNYRVIAMRQSFETPSLIIGGGAQEHQVTTFSIHEAFYELGAIEPTVVGSTPIPPTGLSLEMLGVDIFRLALALELSPLLGETTPFLDERDLPRRRKLVYRRPPKRPAMEAAHAEVPQKQPV